MKPIRPHSLAPAIASARKSIDACVVVGGDIFADPAASNAFSHAIMRGIKTRMLFPSPTSEWLTKFTDPVKIQPSVYAKRFIKNADAVNRYGENLVRWYSTPGPCWFILIDQRFLYTKPMSIQSDTFPIREHRNVFIEHYYDLFHEIWETSVSNFTQLFSSINKSTRIELVDLSEELMDSLIQSPDEINNISPETFELLIADRLSAMGMGVKQVGNTYSKDGGVDIIAWPDHNFSYPFLLAVQAKHSRVGRHVGSSTVRDMKGVLSEAKSRGQVSS